MLNDVSRNTSQRAVDILNIIAGVFLLLSPWLLGFAAEATAAWNAWIVGALIALVAIGAVVKFQQWEEWFNVLLGAWAIVSPWLLGFAGVSMAVTAHVIAGILVVAFAAYELWAYHNRPTSTA